MSLLDKSAGDSLTLENWRTAPFSDQSFHRVESLVPAVPVEPAPESWAFDQDSLSIERIAFEDGEERERLVGEVLQATHTRGLVVLRGGRLVAEGYWRGYDGTRPHILFSVTKSVTGALAGILVERGGLDPDSPVTRYIPEVGESAYGDCSVRHVLDMTVSSSFEEDYNNTDGDYVRYRRATLWNPIPPGAPRETLRSFLATMPRAEDAHGEVFRYLSPNSDLLGWILERAAGQSFSDLLSQKIWRPLGAEARAITTVDAEGAPRTAGGLCALVRDLARFGEAMRLGGKVRGQDILPGWWVEDIRSGGDGAPWQKGAMQPLFPAGRYRSKWYQTGSPNGAFCAIGIHGQWLWIDPAHEVVIAKVSTQPDPICDSTDLLLMRAFEAIAESV